MSLGDPNEVYKALQNLYVRAESLMIKPEGYKPLLTLLSDIRQKFENLTNLLEALDEQEAVNLNFSKNSTVVENQQFEEHVQRWIKDTEDKLSKESRAFSYERSSVRTGSQSTSSSIRSEKQRSLVKLKIATAAVQQESARVYETRQKTRERAEEMKRKLMREAEEARQKAEREAEEARQRAEQEVEEARKRANEAMEEVNRQMKLEEEELERVLLDKKRNEELARIEAEAWEELSCGKAEEGTSTRKVPHLKKDYELFPLLHQYCESHVQSKFSYVSNQSPVTAFQKAWDILFDEYGHPYEIAKCCEERLKNVHKIPDDDKNKLKSLSQLLEKCCVSLKNIEQVSSLDSMYVIMGVVNKLPINLKQAWVEYAVLVRERSFLICPNLLQKKVELLILFLVEKRFKTNYKPRR